MEQFNQLEGTADCDPHNSTTLAETKPLGMEAASGFAGALAVEKLWRKESKPLKDVYNRFARPSPFNPFTLIGLWRSLVRQRKGEGDVGVFSSLSSSLER
jgi:hypothetical protein